MDTGLELIHNGRTVASAYAIPAENQLLLLSIAGWHGYVSTTFQCLHLRGKGKSYITDMYISMLSLQDKIDINIKKTENIFKQLPEDDYVNFIRLQHYNYLHKMLYDPVEIIYSEGLKFSINDKTIYIPFIKNRRITFVINQYKDEITVGLGTTDKVADTVSRSKHWITKSSTGDSIAKSKFCLGDTISIELIPLDKDKETPCISEEEYADERSSHQRMINDYNFYHRELTKDGILK
jgi:hypothetical protein